MGIAGIMGYALGNLGTFGILGRIQNLGRFKNPAARQKLGKFKSAVGAEGNCERKSIRTAR